MVGDRDLGGGFGVGLVMLGMSVDVSGKVMVPFRKCAFVR